VIDSPVVRRSPPPQQGLEAIALPADDDERGRFRSSATRPSPAPRRIPKLTLTQEEEGDASVAMATGSESADLQPC
jgi:hypothetical protein